MAFAFEGQGGLDSFFSNSLLPSGSWGDMDDDDDGEFNSFNFPAVAVLPKPALKRHSSHTNLQLFNEGVFQVPKFDSPQGQSRESFDGSSSPPRDATTPRRDACNTPDSGSGGSDVASFMPFSPSRFGVCVRARRAANANLTVRDALLGQELRLEVNANTTFGDLKWLVQSVQASSGVRVIPTHFQVLSLDGVELDDAKNVLDVIPQHPRSASLVAVEPRVTELLSFFLSSVCDLSRPPPGESLSGELLGVDSEESQFAMDGDDDSSLEGRKSSSSSCGSPPDAQWPSPPFSKAAPSAWMVRKHDLAKSLEQLTIKVSESKGDVSERVMALISGQPTPLDRGFGSFPSPTISFQDPAEEAAAMALESSMAPWLRGSLDALLLGELSKEGEFDSHRYHSHSHLVVRERAAALPHLARFRLAQLGELVREVQDGLLQGNKPEEIQEPILPYDPYADPEEDEYEESGAARCGSIAAASFDVYGSSAPVSDPLSCAMMGRLETAEHHARARSEPDERPSNTAHFFRGRSRSVSLADFDYGDLVTGCCGGTYMMYNSRGEVAAVFKPIDEEPFGPSNPKGFVGRADEESQMKRGIPVGGGAVRECAAFLLDHDGRAAVPATTMLRISHTTLLPDQAEVQIKVGSLQRFCPHECTAEDIGTAGFGVDQVHAIGIFDARIFNMDRNSDNLLVASKKGVWSARTLIPIDHGYILPSIQHLEEVQVCWLHWPQAHVPFSPSTLATIAALDAKAEGAMLRATLGFGEEALMTLFLGTAIVQHAARAGLTLHDIGMLATPGDSGNSPSSVEKLVAHALASVPADWHLCGPAAVEAVQAAMLVGVEDLVAGAVDQLRRRRASSLFQGMAAKGLLRSAERRGSRKDEEGVCVAAGPYRA